MVLVPAGYFTMGDSDGERDQQPSHRLYLDAFFIDRYGVTNQLYHDFLRYVYENGDSGIRHSYQPRSYDHTPAYWETDQHKPDMPIRGISWFDAYALAKWQRKRLPTEAEWEKVARGDGKENDGKRQYGVYHLVRNAWEWVADWYDPYYYEESPTRNPAGPELGRTRVVRGSYKTTQPDQDAVSTRDHYTPTTKEVPDGFLGFRCASDVNVLNP